MEDDAPSPIVSPPPDLSPVIRLAPELQEQILFFCVYTGGEFDTENFEYGNPDGPNPVLMRRHAWFARAVAPANKSLYRMALPILWKYLPVRTTKALKHLAWLGKRGCLWFRGDGMMKNVKRVDFCIPSWPHTPDDDRLPSFLHPMLNLRVVNVRPPQIPLERLIHGGYSHHDLMEAPVRIERLQFDTLPERPSLYDLRYIFKKHPKLKTLRLTSIAPYPYIGALDWSGVRAVTVMDALTGLSLGDPAQNSPSSEDMLRFNMLIDMLTQNPILPKLSSLHLFTHCTRLPHFFNVFGSQLRTLVTSPSHLRIEGATLDLAVYLPNMQRLVFVLEQWPSHWTSTLMPTSHPTLKEIAISVQNVQYPEHHAPAILGTVFEGRFPQLSDLRVAVSQSLKASISEVVWIQQITDLHASSKNSHVCLSFQSDPLFL